MIDGASLDVIDQAIAAKPFSIALDPGGGLARQEVAPERQLVPAVSGEELRRLGVLARQVVELEGPDRDIEFATSEGHIYLLQSRAITAPQEGGGAAFHAAEFPLNWEHPSLATFGWLLPEEVGRPTLPQQRLFQDVARVYAAHSAKAFAETGAPMIHHYIATFLNGYEYRRPPDDDRSDIGKRLARHSALGASHLRQGTTYYDAVIKPEAREIFRSMGPFRRPPGEPLADRVAHLERALDAYGHVMGDLHWRMAASNGPGGRPDGWIARFRELVSGQSTSPLTFLQAIDNHTTRLVRSVRRLAEIVQSDPVLFEAVRARGYDRLEAPELSHHEAVRRLRAGLGALLRTHGRRSGRGFGSATGSDAKTWNLQPSQLLDLVRSYALQDLPRLATLEAEARAERLNATRAVRRALAHDPDRLAAFEHALTEAQQGVRILENHNYLMEQGISGVLREAVWWVGQALVRDARCDEPDDVLHLTLSELRAASQSAEDLRPLVEERRLEFEHWTRLSPPVSVGAGAVPAPPGRPPEPVPERAGLFGDVLYGLAASKGRRAGRARVVHRQGERPDIEAGDILVAKNAGPDWTPILPLLAGIVLDEGAVFQHAALVAREYRIPAIVQTQEATQVIRDGTRIVVDGDLGLVELAPVVSRPMADGDGSGIDMA